MSMRGRLCSELAFCGCCVGVAGQAQAQSSAPAAASDSTASQEHKSTADAHTFVLGDADDKGRAVARVVDPVPVTSVALSDKKIDHQTKLELIRALNAEVAYAKHPMPKLEKGLVLPANGRLEPGADMMDQLLMQYGVAAKKGDRVQITDMEIRDREIRFVLNGGAKTKHKWYEHVSVGMGGAEVAPMAKADNPNAKGTLLTLTFPKYVPEISAEQVRQLLSPVLDFTVKSPMQAYADTLPPHIKKAVLNHEALVGMNHEMVMAALGRPDKKFRGGEETSDDVEDWMYGKPPATVRFLRFKGDSLVRIKEMPVGAEAIVRDTPEIEASELATFQQERREAVEERKAAREAANRPAPSLRREGDPDPVVPTASDSVRVTRTPGQTGAPGTTPPTIDPASTPGGTSGDPSQYPTRAPVGTQMPGSTGQAPFPGAPGDGSSGPR
ncbi:MAG: hypothetical protein NVS9B15_24550 [Acidobacteriaceae bacterium]